MKILLISILFSLTILPPGYCAFNLSVRPYEGGYELKFGKIEPAIDVINKEVVINITSDSGKQYRLIQELIEPLINQEGVVFPPTNFFVYALRGTNRYGTLSVEQEIPVVSGRTIIYTSGSGGLSDSFNLVYSLKGPLAVPAGFYRARIAFILESTQAGVAPVTAILNVSVEVKGEVYIKITSESGAKNIMLSPRPSKTEAQLFVEMKYGLGGIFRIYQSIAEPLLSQESEKFPLENIDFYLSDIQRGSGLTTPKGLSLKEELLYTSDLRGSKEDFVINYKLGDVGRVKAGIYRTAIKYFLQGPGSGALKLLDTYNLEVEIPGVFELLVRMPLSANIIEFRDLKPEQPPKRLEVEIEAKTNLGKQYQVSQNLVSLLTNKEGKTIPGKFFTLRTEAVDAKGRLKFPSSAEVKTGEMVLYISDKEGLPAHFKVIYELGLSWDIAPGDYSAPIIYSITEL